jgi:hypothetical protein
LANEVTRAIVFFMIRRTCLLAAAAVPLLLSAPSCAPVPQGGGAERAADLSFLPERLQKGRLFNVYNPSGPSLRTNNWTSRFDLSGVSWNDPRTVTAISPVHVVMAAHYARPTFTPVVFHDRKGRMHARKITRIMPLGGGIDIAVGLLDEPLPPDVARYRIATAANLAPMQLVLVTDQTMTLSLHRLGGIDSQRVILGNDPQIPRGYWRKLVTGDSGNPAFVMRGGELLLLTTFTSGGSGSGPFYGDPQVRAALDRAVTRLR